MEAKHTYREKAQMPASSGGPLAGAAVIIAWKSYNAITKSTK